MPACQWRPSKWPSKWPSGARSVTIHKPNRVGRSGVGLMGRGRIIAHTVLCRGASHGLHERLCRSQTTDLSSLAERLRGSVVREVSELGG